MKHIVGFSGGVDSQACALWVRQRFPAQDVILLNSDAGGNEHPLTTEFLLWYSANVHPVTFTTPIVGDMNGKARAKQQALGLLDSDPLTFATLAKLKGCFPTRKKQFCTDHLKLAPQRRWLYENGAAGLNIERRRRDGEVWKYYGEDGQKPGILADGYTRYVGVRRDESDRRKDYPERFFDDYNMCWVEAPLVTWTKPECFRLLRQAGERWNPLYEMGFSRVGCAPCINSNKEDIQAWAPRFPEMIDKVRAWEKETGRTFFGPIMPPKKKGGKARYGWVDEVVEWARTAHGGKQYKIDFDNADQAVCFSKWGTCE